jgi:hypothetical protein
MATGRRMPTRSKASAPLKGKAVGIGGIAQFFGCAAVVNWAIHSHSAMQD